MPFNCPHCSQAIDNYIPKDRFDEVNNSRREWEETAKKAQEERDNAAKKARYVDELEKRINDSVRANAAAQQRTQRDIALLESGIRDSSIRRIFAEEYERSGKGKSAADWVASLSTAPETMPLALRVLYAEATKSGTPPHQSASAPPTPPAPTPQVNAGAVTAPPQSALSVTPTDILRMPADKLAEVLPALEAQYPQLKGAASLFKKN